MLQLIIRRTAQDDRDLRISRKGWRLQDRSEAAASAYGSSDYRREEKKKTCIAGGGAAGRSGTLHTYLPATRKRTDYGEVGRGPESAIRPVPSPIEALSSYLPTPQCVWELRLAL
jgi:hypothetical protein